MKLFSEFDAIHSLVGGGITQTATGTITYQDGQTPPTEEAIQSKLKELQADYDAKKYQRDRNYSSVGEQLDMIYWDKKNGTKKWEEAIDKVKADHPKG